jgi:ABC-type transport system involved in multi-copper enzyme maturation permease subunit
MMGNIGNIHLVQSLKGLWVKLLLIGGALFTFEMLFAIVGTSAQVYQGMLHDMEDIPPMVEKMMGTGFVEAVIKYGVIALGYVHPFMLILFIVFIFIAVSQVVTSEVSSGTIGFTLSKPVSRVRLYINLMIVIYVGLAVLSLFTFLSSALGIVFFYSEKLAFGPFSSLAWNLFLLMVFIAGYIVIFAAISDTGKKLFTIGGITLFAFYILDMATPLWNPLKYLSPVNPFSYYDPMPMLMGSRISSEKSMLIIVVSVVMFGFGAWLFSRRDLASG